MKDSCQCKSRCRADLKLPSYKLSRLFSCISSLKKWTLPHHSAGLFQNPCPLSPSCLYSYVLSTALSTHWFGNVFAITGFQVSRSIFIAMLGAGWSLARQSSARHACSSVLSTHRHSTLFFKYTFTVVNPSHLKIH